MVLLISPSKFYVMTDTAIQKQISDQMKALERTTRDAVKSKQSANQYLKDLGLIKGSKVKVNHEKHQITKKGK